MVGGEVSGAGFYPQMAQMTQIKNGFTLRREGWFTTTERRTRRREMNLFPRGGRGFVVV